MDIKSLRYFLAVTEEGNITKAAKRLCIAQPPLSRQLQLLEEELGVVLFERGKRRIQLTEEGYYLKRQAEEILAIRGIDVAIVGRGDLAHSMGLSGKTTDERVSQQVERVYAAARKFGKTPGLLVNDVAGAKKWLDRGIKFLTFGSEVGWLISAYQKGIQEINNHPH